MDVRPDREVEYIVPSTLDDPLHTISGEEESNLHEHRRRQSADSAPRFAQAEDDVKMKFRNLVVSTYDTYMKNKQAGLLPPETKRLTIVFDKNDMVESFRFGDHVMGDEFKEDFRRFLLNPQFIPPEVNTGPYVKQNVEVWILGITLFSMLVGRHPFSGKTDRTLFKKMLRSDFTIPDNLSNEAKDLIRRMLAPDPKRRASFDLILFHPWMKSVPSIFVSSASITSETSKHPYTMSLTSPLPDHNYLAVSSNHHQLSPDFNTIETYSSIHRTPSATSPKTKSVMRNVLSSAASGVRSIFRYLTEGPNPPPKSGYADGKARRSAPYPPTSPRRAERAERVLRPGVGGDGVPIVDGDWRRNLMNDIVQSSVVKGKDNSDVS